MDTEFKKSLPSMTDWLSKWIYTYKKQIYLKKRPPRSEKKPKKSNTPNNYRPITWLPMVWQILTAQRREEIYDLLISRGLFLRNRNDATSESRRKHLNRGENPEWHLKGRCAIIITVCNGDHATQPHT